MATASDNFDRADANNLGANWTDAKGYNSVMRCAIVSNSAGYPADQGEGNPEVSDYYSGTSFGADQFSQATVVALGAYFTAVTVRSATSGTAKKQYLGGADPNDADGLLRIWKMNPGYASLVAHSSDSLAVGNVVKLTAEGTTLKLYINDVEKLSITDTDLSAGQPGMALYHSSYGVALLDSWSGGDLGGTETGTHDPMWFDVR